MSYHFIEITNHDHKKGVILLDGVEPDDRYTKPWHIVIDADIQKAYITGGGPDDVMESYVVNIVDTEATRLTEAVLKEFEDVELEYHQDDDLADCIGDADCNPESREFYDCDTTYTLDRQIGEMKDGVLVYHDATVRLVGNVIAELDL
jgi:hypothetical protein